MLILWCSFGRWYDDCSYCSLDVVGLGFDDSDEVRVCVLMMMVQFYLDMVW